MLKGFVSGEEKDIVRIPMKGKNLWDGTLLDGYLENNSFELGGSGTIYKSIKVYLTTGTYTISTSNQIRIIRTIFDGVWSTQNIPDASPYNFSVATDGYIGVSIQATQNNVPWDSSTTIMLNAGTESLPYEPYGYQEGWEVRDNQDRIIWGREDELQTATGTLPFKGYSLPLKTKSLLGNAVQNGTPAPDNIITPEMCGKLVGTDWTIPLTNSGQTLPVYLGEIPTVRRVKKLVLTGEEDWIFRSGEPQNVYFLEMQNLSVINNLGICTHYPNQDSGNFSSFEDKHYIARVSTDGTKSYLSIRDSSFAYLANFKSWLAAQYAAGHPVIVWYVLANEQTGISNEPLAKIGTYADELTTIQVHGLSAPLYGIGDYKDTLNLSTGVVTRKVKKLVLTGQENVTDLGDYYNCGVTIGSIAWRSAVSTTGGFIASNNGRALLAQKSYFSAFTTEAAFKSYLAAQYQNGTPVTIWYILSTPTTETVTVPTGMTGEIEGYLTQVSTPTPTNRSVPKWNGVEETGGTYAVAVYTPPEIPTTTGQNTLTVETEKIHGLTNPLCGIGDYKDVLNLSTGVITRKVKKLVLTGNENWALWSSGQPDVERYYYKWGKSTPSDYGLISTHLPFLKDDGNFEHISLGGSSRDDFVIFISKTIASTVADFKSYLAAQYQAGTPVTAWYVISTPETETITVPYGLECSVEGYLTQSDTPTPSSPITPDSNGILESDGTYAVEASLVPSNLTVKGHIKELT